MSVETRKPTINYLNIDTPSEELKATFLPNRTYWQPQYKLGIIPTAAGSVDAQDEHVKCTVAIYGPTQSLSSAFSEQGSVSCEILYAPYAGHHIDHTQRPRHTGTKGSRELAMANIVQEVFSSTIQLHLLQKHQVNISVTIHQQSTSPQYDLSFVLNAISIALSTTGIQLYDTLLASTVFFVPSQKNQIAQDLLLNGQQDSEIQLGEHISLYPQQPLLVNALKNAKIAQNPPVALTLVYLPSLNQLIYSKLDGVLPPSAKDKAEQFKVLSNVGLKHVTLLKVEMRTVLQNYMRVEMLKRLAQTQNATKIIEKKDDDNKME